MRMKKSDLVDQLKCAQVNYEALTVTAIRIGHVVDSLAKIIDENGIKVDWLKLGMGEQNETVDAVEVVRCRDCEFAHREDNEYPWFSCHNLTLSVKNSPTSKRSVGGGSMSPREGCSQLLSGEGYCGYGKRKDGAEHE